MKFDKYLPNTQLAPYIKYFAVSEKALEETYRVFPSSGLVIGFQYRGQLSTITANTTTTLDTAGITGIADRYKVFKNSSDIGTILVFFTEIGFTHFASHPANELLNLSVSLDNIFNKNQVTEVEDRLAHSSNNIQRIGIVEQFLMSQLKHIETDMLIVEAVKLIYQSKGAIRIKQLNDRLAISASPFEKRFRKVVGTTAKKFASIVRFNSVLNALSNTKTLTEICYEYNFFDQAHLIKDFKQFTGVTPENFKRFL